jgi:hypothetical protein
VQLSPDLQTSLQKKHEAHSLLLRLLLKNKKGRYQGCVKAVVSKALLGSIKALLRLYYSSIWRIICAQAAAIASNVCGLQQLVYEAFSYECVRP